MIIPLWRHEITDIHSQVATVNLYEFAHHSIHDFSAKWLGVVHGANYPYDFGISFLSGPSIQYCCSFLAVKWKTENTVDTVIKGPKHFGRGNG